MANSNPNLNFNPQFFPVMNIGGYQYVTLVPATQAPIVPPPNAPVEFLHHTMDHPVPSTGPIAVLMVPGSYRKYCIVTIPSTGI